MASLNQPETRYQVGYLKANLGSGISLNSLKPFFLGGGAGYQGALLFDGRFPPPNETACTLPVGYGLYMSCDICDMWRIRGHSL